MVRINRFILTIRNIAARAGGGEEESMRNRVEGDCAKNSQGQGEKRSAEIAVEGRKERGMRRGLGVRRERAE
jgi:hypothetical protein